ncbi:MAG: murein biosynthesis integral membrane protein MurJ [Planctomycetes bacterium]|nr:murein biosynthesis integral membrane protein MurJ [Planctomycetota bacterium]
MAIEAPKVERTTSVHGGFLRSARTVSVLTLLSRVLGMLRDAATAYVLGAGVVNDALTWAWTIPNAFRRLFGEGALSSAFLPVLTRELQQNGREGARRVANEVVSTFGVFLIGLAALLVLAAGFVPDGALVWAFGDDKLVKMQLALGYVQFLLPYLVVVCLIAQFMAVLHALDEFGVPAFSPVILNTVWLAGIGLAAWWGHWGSPDTASEALRVTQGFFVVGAILVASVAQFAWHLRPMAKLGVGFRFVRPRRSPEVRRVAALMGPMLLGLGAAQINIVADRSIAIASLPDGGTTHLYYGLRLMQFPLGMVSVALATAVYPSLARMAATHDRHGLAATTSLALRTNLLIALPAAAGLAVLASPIVRLLFLGGQFGEPSALLTERALVGYTLGVPFAGSVMLLTRASYAAGDVRLPVRIGVVMVFVNIGLDLLLVGPLQELGLALATSITSLLTAAWLLYGLRARLELSPDERLLVGGLPALLPAAVMALVVVGLDAALATLLPAGRLAMGARVAAGVGAGALVFAFVAARTCPVEWHEVAALWKRRR